MSANTIRVGSQHDEAEPFQLYNVGDSKAEPAPTIVVQISSSTGTKEVKVLPDSGADISAAGQDVMKHLGQHMNNLLPSKICPRTVNGSHMRPLGKIPITIQLRDRRYEDEMHIYPGVSGALISWRAAIGLGILPPHYPYPLPVRTDRNQSEIKAMAMIDNQKGTAEEIMQEFPSVFGIMEGEKFHITLVDNATPFCVKAPRSVPFAYRDKLKAELELLQEQGIITPVTEVTEWCSPIVVTPKKGTDRIRMCVDLSKLNR